MTSIGYHFFNVDPSCINVGTNIQCHEPLSQSERQKNIMKSHMTHICSPLVPMAVICDSYVMCNDFMSCVTRQGGSLHPTLTW